MDFNPYSSPGRTIQLFFEHFEARKPMVVAITDGILSDPRNCANVKWDEMYLWNKGDSDKDELPCPMTEPRLEV